MIRRQEYDGLVWIDLETPTTEEVGQIASEYGVHPLVAEELSLPSRRSRVDRYADFIYLILHFPICSVCYGQPVSNGQDHEEIDFVIGKNFLLTVHYQPIEGLTEFARVFVATRLKETSTRRDDVHAGHLFFYLVKHLYGSLSTGFDYINSLLKQAEQKIFSGEEKAMVRLLSSVNRDLLDFRWTLKTHRQTLDSLVIVTRDFFDQNFQYYLSAILGEYEKIWTMLENNHETFLDLRQTNDSLLSIKTNETMKVLAVLAFIFFPLTIVAQFFSMNTSLPLVGQPHDLFFVLGIMVLLISFMFALAKERRWL
ncbi:MAG: CorA family divalent cation transporter [Patescibacteria group bacterium]